MTRRRWIADEATATTAALLGENARHLAQVLRAQAGQRFDVACGGMVYSATVTSVDNERVEFELGEPIPDLSVKPIALALAIFKFDRFEWALEKAVELGAAKIHPVIARRTDIHLARSAQKRHERWQKIARESAQQARRGTVPVIYAPAKLKEKLSAFPESLRILLAESETDAAFVSVLGEAPGKPLVLAVGPEGGWAEDELGAFAAAGWKPATLGPTILRAETAAMAAVALAASLR